MRKFEKGFRMLNETELNEIHGGRRTGGQVEFCAYCEVQGCNWSSGWSDNQARVEQQKQNHQDLTGHSSFSTTSRPTNM